MSEAEQKTKTMTKTEPKKGNTWAFTKAVLHDTGSWLWRCKKVFIVTGVGVVAFTLVTTLAGAVATELATDILRSEK